LRAKCQARGKREEPGEVQQIHRNAVSVFTRIRSLLFHTFSLSASTSSSCHAQPEGRFLDCPRSSADEKGECCSVEERVHVYALTADEHRHARASLARNATRIRRFHWECPGQLVHRSQQQLCIQLYPHNSRCYRSPRHAN